MAKNAQLESSLKEIFQIEDSKDEVSLMKNGLYHVKKYYGRYANADQFTEVYIPSNLPEGVSVYGYLCGAGGARSDALPLRNIMESETPPECITIIAPVSQDPTNILELATSVIEKNNSQVTGVELNGFSAGVQYEIPAMGNYLNNHPEYADRAGILMVDGWVNNSYKKEAGQILKDNAVPIIYLSSTGAHLEGNENAKKADVFPKQMGQAGYNAFSIKSKESGHGGINRNALNNGVGMFFLGLTDIIGNKNGKEEGIDYLIRVWNPEKNDFTTLLNMGESKDFSAIGLMVFGNAIPIALIQSDNELLQGYLTNINMGLYNLQSTVFSLTVSSSTQVPTVEVGLVNKLCSSLKMLCEKTREDMIKFGEVGNKFKDLDIKLEQEADELMKDFIAPLNSTDLKIKLNDLDTHDFDLTQLIKDYNKFVEDFKASIPEHSPETMRDKDMKEILYLPSAEDLDLLFLHWAETTGNPKNQFLGMGAAFIAASQATGIDPFTLIGVSGHETGYGGIAGDSIANNNFFGLEGADAKFETPEDGIMAGALKLKADYDNGKTSVGLIKFNPDDENTDTTYGDKVGTIMDESLDYVVDTIAKPLELPKEETTTTTPKKTTPRPPGGTPPTKPEDTKPEEEKPEEEKPEEQKPEEETPEEEKPDETTPEETQPEEDNPDTGTDVIVEPEPEPEPDPGKEEDTTPKKPKRPDPIPDPSKPKKPSPIPTPKNDDSKGDQQGSNKYIDLDEEGNEVDPDEPGIVINPDTPEVPETEEGIIIEETPDDEPIDEPEVEPTPTPEPEQKESGGGSVLKTIGVMTAVGAGVGAAAYAAHRVIEKNNSDDDHYSYEDDKGNNDQQGLEEKEYYSEDLNQY